MNAIQGKPSFIPSGINKAERFVIYHRVSTTRQGASGLGLDAQGEAVSVFFASRPHQVVATFTEIESGKRSDRPELLKALAECRKRKATLVIAKLDRLSRNLAFIANLIEGGVEFVCCDNPFANRMQIQLLAVFAEFERELISKRTKDALAMAKARGVQLGVNGRRLAEQHKAEARQRDKLHHTVVASLMRELRSYTAVAERMNAMAVATPSGGRWYASTVRNMCLRAL